MQTRRRWLALPIALGALLAGGLVPSSAMATRGYDVEIMDDQLLLGRSAERVDRVLAEFARIGVDRLRVSAFWRDIAPGRDSRRKPSFEAGDHRSGYNWTSLDQVVGTAAKYQLKVLVSITGPGPLWSSSSPSRGRVWKPKVDEFALFARATANRYREAVDQFAIWNEPNQGAWLRPQSEGGRLYAPHHYRQLVNAAYPQIKEVAPASTVLIGELAPSGRDDRGTTRPIRPLTFLRAFGCRTSRYRAIRSGPCAGFQAPTGDAFSHHPYSGFASPFGRSSRRNDATFGDTTRLLSVIDRLQRSGGLRKAGGGRFPLHYTEFGWQTNPPDPFSGITLGRQDRYIQDAAYRAWAHPRIRSINQFRLIDGRIRRAQPGFARYLEFQSGLKFENGRPKPSYTSFKHPIRASRRAVRRGGAFTLWGQVRPGGRHSVTIQRRLGRSWTTLATVSTDDRGGFRRRIRAGRTARYRFRYSDGPRGTSDSVLVRAR